MGTLLRLLIRGLKGGWTQIRNVPILLLESQEVMTAK